MVRTAKKGLFLVFDGGEGCGKSSLADFLVQHLESAGYPALLTKEPGGDELICAQIRKILLDPSYRGLMSSRAELLLFEADRAQHVDMVIRPALEAERIVVCDRFEAATFAYQCAARRVCSGQEFTLFNRFATGGLEPDFTFWADVDPRIGLKRNKDRGKRDRFEIEEVEFHDRVREGYGTYFRNFVPSSAWQKLDGSLPLEELQRQVLGTLKRLI